MFLSLVQWVTELRLKTSSGLYDRNKTTSDFMCKKIFNKPKTEMLEVRKSLNKWIIWRCHLSADGGENEVCVCVSSPWWSLLPCSRCRRCRTPPWSPRWARPWRKRRSWAEDARPWRWTDPPQPPCPDSLTTRGRGQKQQQLLWSLIYYLYFHFTLICLSSTLYFIFFF